MKLTGKQDAFARAVVELDPVTGNSRSLSDAYRLAYDASGMSAEAINVEASRTRANPKISLRIDELQGAEARLRERNAGSRARGVLSRLNAICDDPEAPAAARVAALKLIGQDAGLWSSKVEVELAVASSESASRSELVAGLREILRSAPPDAPKLVAAEIIEPEG